MSFMVVLIVDNEMQFPEILDAWEKSGAPGVTILESTGLGRVRRKGLMEDLPLMPSLSDLLQRQEVHHRTIFTVVDDESLIDQLVEVTHGIIGSLDEPNTGFLFVIPVLRAYGLGRARDSQQ